MYTTEAEGAIEISQEQFDEVKQFFEDENYEEIGEIFEELTEFPDWKLEGSLKYGKFYIDDDSLKWVTEEKGEQDGDMNSGSQFEIKETTLKKLRVHLLHTRKMLHLNSFKPFKRKVSSNETY